MKKAVPEWDKDKLPVLDGSSEHINREMLRYYFLLLISFCVSKGLLKIVVSSSCGIPLERTMAETIVGARK